VGIVGEEVQVNSMNMKKSEWEWKDFDWSGCDEDWAGDAD